jgi:uroporphyrinogen III methyltransferase/synthase
MNHSQNTRLGKVYLVGAGPGDPSLITLKGVECLRRADLVLADYLVNPVLLGYAPPSADVVRLGRHDQADPIPADEINARMIAAAREGKTVVRLKGGDPSVFGRGAEETEALRQADIPHQIVPGITAALAAAATAEIPITHGESSPAVALVIAHESRGKKGPALDYATLADFPGTLVFYMGAASAGQWSDALVRRGKSPETAVAIVRRCSWNDQETIRCTLGTVAETIQQRAVRPPTVVFVGPAVALAPKASWFSQRPLFGVRVLVTRPLHQAESLAERLDELGADISFQPVIEIADPADWGPVDRALRELDQYDWLVFSSANGVCYLLDRLWKTHGDLRSLAGVKLAAIGPGTAEELARYRLRADVVPGQYRAEALAEALAGEAAGRRFLLARASRGREVLAEGLLRAGGLVDQIVVYRSSDVAAPDPEIAAALAAGQFDWITVTSSAIAQSLARLFGDDLRKARLASISPVTSETLRRLGHRPAVEATQYTMAGLATDIAAAAQGAGERE